MVGRITLDGFDGQLMHFSCPSFTTPGTVYTLVLDRPQMKVTCDCMDAVCRKKVWYLLAESSDLCKHLRSLRRYVLPRLREAGVFL